jgi:hypothetical protein
LYDWLSQSNVGQFILHGQSVTIAYLQGGANGQGKILIEPGEVDRLKDMMRVGPSRAPARRSPAPTKSFPGITVKLGRPCV